MRIAIVCAAFALGLIAGAWFWPSREPAARGAQQGARIDREAPESAAPASDSGDSVTTLAAEAAAVLDRNVTDPDPWLRGGGTIAGTVTDPDGRPVAGCVISAQPEGSPSGVALATRGSRDRQHEDTALDVLAREAIERELWRRRSRRIVTTGADGRFVLEGLPDKTFRIQAFHERYVVEPAAPSPSCAPGAVLDFVAQPAVEVRIEVRVPDGGSPVSAYVTWRGPHGRGYGPWTPLLDRMRLPLGHVSLSVSAAQRDHVLHGEVETDIDAAARDPIVVRLRARPTLTVRLRMPEGLALPPSVEYRARRLADGEQPDLAASDDMTLEGRGLSPGQATWHDIGLGRYLVAAFLYGQKPLAHAVVEVKDGPAETELMVPDPRGGPHVVVHVQNADGRPIIGSVSFELRAGQRYARPDTHRLVSGGWLLALPKDVLESAAASTILASTRTLGSVALRHDLRNPGPVTMRFVPPGRLKLRIDAYGGSGVEGRLSSSLCREEYQVTSSQIGGDGECTLVGQPGEYRIQLLLSDARERWVIHEQRLALATGDADLTIPLPALHSLRVRGNARVFRGVELEWKGPFRSHRREARFDAEGVAHFDGLVSGVYSVRCGKTMEVRVPGQPEVTFE